VGIAGSLDVNTIANATTDTDRFLVSDTGIIKYRTGSQLLTDIGAQAAGNYVTTDTSQAITASKSFTVGFSLASEGLGNQTSFFRNTSSLFSGSGGSNIFGFNSSNNIYFGKGLNNGGVLQWNNTTATRYYTLPDADGTIALTSSLSGYLPLTGGTLTGALNGTSASFTGNIITSAGFFNFGNNYGIQARNFQDTAYRTVFKLNTSNQIEIGRSTDISDIILGTASATNALTIASTGAATFSTNSNSTIVNTFQNTNTTNTNSRNMLNVTAGNVTLQLTAIHGDNIYISPSTAVSTYIGYNNTVQIASTGAATFTGPALPLAIASTNATELYTEYKYNTSTVVGYIGNGAGIVTGASSSDFGIRAQADLILASGGNNRRVTITSGGNVGIGTASPTAKLEVQNSPANDWGLSVWGNTTTGQSYGGIVRGGTNASDVAFRVNNAANSLTYFTVQGNGKVGIGTGNPDNSYQGLTISGTDPSLRLKTTSGSGWVWTEYVTSAGVNNFSMGVNQTQPYFGIKAGAGLDNPNFAMTSSGNVLIGTTTDNGNKLQIFTTSTATNVITITNGTQNLNLGVNNSAGSFIFESSNTNLRFGTNDTERMRITSGGFLKAKGNESTYQAINTGYHELRTGSGDEWITFFSNASGSPYGIRIHYPSVAPNNTSNLFLLCSDINASRLAVLANGNVQNQNNSYGALSDIKLKENITDASPKLDNLMKVKIRNYNLIGEDTKQLGVIAQELEEIFPAMIEESPDRDKDGNYLGTTTKSVKYSVFVPMLIKAIQEQQIQIDKLKNL
jgi:hypothetical protein